MPEISTCPRCQRQVSIPRGVDPVALVRCPLCDAEYPLSQALPPELIPVVTPAAQRPGDIVKSGEDLVEEAETYGLAEPLAAKRAGEEVAEEEQEDQAAAVVARMPIGATRVRRRPPKPWWQTFLEVVTGGLAGCLVAYYGLAFWYGPQLPLPKYSFLPFIAQWTAPPEKAEGAGEKPAAEKPAKPKSAEEKVPPPNKTPPEIATPKPEPKPLRPKPGSADYVGPRMPSSFTSDQLDKAIKEADDILFAGRTDKPMPPKTFEAFCRLGEAVAFVNGDAADTTLTDRLDAAEKLLAKVAALPESCEKLGQMAQSRIDAKSGQNTGVLLAGTVKNVAKQGRLWGAVVQLGADPSTTVSVLSDRELEARVDDRVLVLGVVVHAPATNLVGYSGSKPAVVWAAALVKSP